MAARVCLACKHFVTGSDYQAKLYFGVKKHNPKSTISEQENNVLITMLLILNFKTNKNDISLFKVF